MYIACMRVYTWDVYIYIWIALQLTDLRLAVLLCLSGSPLGAMAILGTECSTFVPVNKVTEKRDELNPWGTVLAPLALAANMASSRQAASFLCNACIQLTCNTCRRILYCGTADACYFWCFFVAWATNSLSTTRPTPSLGCTQGFNGFQSPQSPWSPGSLS